MNTEWLAPPWGAIITVFMSGADETGRPSPAGRGSTFALFPKGASGQGAQRKQDGRGRMMFFVS